MLQLIFICVMMVSSNHDNNHYYHKNHNYNKIIKCNIIKYDLPVWAWGENMKTQYITKFINEFGQIDIYGLLCKINELCRFKLYRVAEKMVDELYQIYTGTQFDDINNDLFVLGFDNECEMFLLIEKISNKLYNTKNHF